MNSGEIKDIKGICVKFHGKLNAQGFEPNAWRGFQRAEAAAWQQWTITAYYCHQLAGLVSYMIINFNVKKFKNHIYREKQFSKEMIQINITQLSREIKLTGVQVECLTELSMCRGSSITIIDNLTLILQPVGRTCLIFDHKFYCKKLRKKSLIYIENQ